MPLPPMVVTVLREHRLACANGSLGLAFPNSKGSIEHRNTIVQRVERTVLDASVARLLAVRELAEGEPERPGNEQDVRPRSTAASAGKTFRRQGYYFHILR